jgi:hypothetical protein
MLDYLVEMVDYIVPSIWPAFKVNSNRIIIIVNFKDLCGSPFPASILRIYIKPLN